MTLPINTMLPDLRRTLKQASRVVLQAPPGAGKTTGIPIALLDADWLEGQRIVMLEPRRLAARVAARRMAAILGQAVGETVGYRMRLDSRVGPETRIEVVTEGVFTRMLQSDPELEGVGLVIFDEFHERSLQADLGLVLCLDSQGTARPELRLLVMSATLDAEAVASWLGNAPLLRSKGRSFPVTTRYRPALERADRTPLSAVVRVVLEAMVAEDGDILVFLPGVGEIRRVQQRLAQCHLHPDVEVLPLHGRLGQADQERALRPASPGVRKVVLATSIAETSLTIEGTRVVIDSGRMRLPLFDPVTGMSRLATQRVSKASADQRRGRAGRLGPGVCYRLWSAEAEKGFLPQSVPEILSADLAALVLELACWGVQGPASLSWQDPPPAAGVAQARTLLQELEALDHRCRPTAHGRCMAELPVHPRLAHMLLRARDRGWGSTACGLAALLSDHLPLQAGEAPNVDLRLHIEALAADSAAGSPQESDALSRIRRNAKQLARQLDIAWGRMDPSVTGRLVALAYPDRIGQLRSGDQGRYRLSGGGGARLVVSDPLADQPFLAIAELDGAREDARVFSAAPLQLGDLAEEFAAQLRDLQEVFWDAAGMQVRSVQRRRLWALVLQERTVPVGQPERALEVFLQALRRVGLSVLPWKPDLKAWRARVMFVARLDPEGSWPDVTEAGLLANLEEWLGPFLMGKTRVSEITADDLRQALEMQLTWPQRKRLETWAPRHWQTPSGSRIHLDYESGDVPILAVRIQEMFGCRDTPRLAEGRVPVLLHLLSPASRPVQVTQDLAGFWDKTYKEVKKDLKGRYPKHHWPDDPLQAQPTRRTRFTRP